MKHGSEDAPNDEEFYLPHMHLHVHIREEGEGEGGREGEGRVEGGRKEGRRGREKTQRGNYLKRSKGLEA